LLAFVIRVADAHSGLGRHDALAGPGIVGGSEPRHTDN